MTTLRTIIDSLTLDQAKQWQATEEKWIFVDDLLLEFGFSAMGVRPGVIDAIENKLESMLNG